MLVSFQFIGIDFYVSKKKAAHKATSGDDTRLQNCLRRMQVNSIPGIEEVNIFQGENVIHFANPKGMMRLYEFDAGPLT